MGEGSGGREFVALGEEEESILSKKGNKGGGGGGVVSSPFPFHLSCLWRRKTKEERKFGRKNSSNC